MIREIARTVKIAAAPAYSGRLGGDEFALIVPDVGATIALEMAEDLCDVVSNAPVVDPRRRPRHDQHRGRRCRRRGRPRLGLARADLALYEAKRAAATGGCSHRASTARPCGGCCSAWPPRWTGTMCLDAAIVDLATGRTRRHELLIRLRDGLEPELGPEFLPAAERTDLVLRIAGGAARSTRWRRRGTRRACASR